MLVPDAALPCPSSVRIVFPLREVNILSRIPFQVNLRNAVYREKKKLAEVSSTWYRCVKYCNDTSNMHSESKHLSGYKHAV